MSVIVEKARPYRCCNSCNSNDGVVEITALMRVGKTEQGTQIALCESCAQMLRFALNSRYKGYGEQENGSWVCSDDMYETGICSHCGWDTAEAWSMCNKWYKYCPNCGDKKR